jgi:hypothetical protein
MTQPPANDNILILAAIGVAAFWFMSRRGSTMPRYIQPGAGAAQTNGGGISGQLVSTGGNLLGRLIGQWGGKSSGSGGVSYGGQQDIYPVNAAPSGYSPMTDDMSGYNETTFGGLGIE